MVQEDIISEQEDFKFSLQPNRVDGRPRPFLRVTEKISGTHLNFHKESLM